MTQHRTKYDPALRWVTTFAFCVLSLGACASPSRDIVMKDSAAGDIVRQDVEGTAASQIAFAMADHDLDGRISFEEYRNRSMHVFHEADVNGNRVLDVSEHAAMVGPFATRPIAQPVAAGDFNLALTALFKNHDTDQDGYLSPEEWRLIPRLGETK